MPLAFSRTPSWSLQDGKLCVSGSCWMKTVRRYQGCVRAQQTQSYHFRTQTVSAQCERGCSSLLQMAVAWIFTLFLQETNAVAMEKSLLGADKAPWGSCVSQAKWKKWRNSSGDSDIKVGLVLLLLCCFLLFCGVGFFCIFFLFFVWDGKHFFLNTYNNKS